MKIRTISEVSKELNIPEQEIYYEIRKGNIKRKKMLGRIVIDENGLAFLKKKKGEKKGLFTVSQYCKKYKIGRGAFNYRGSQERINTIKIDGTIYVKELVFKGK